MMKKYVSLFAPLLLLVACSNSDLRNSLPDNRPDYKTSRVGNPLEIPPDLTQSSVDDVLAVPELTGIENANLSTYQQERSASAQQRSSLAASLKNIHRQGDATWIEIAGTPDVVFRNAKSFWVKNGLSLVRADEKIGIMETDWLEAKDDMPTGGIAKLISTVISPLKDNGMRDKFRTRVDFDGQKTYVYLTHYGATEKEVTEHGEVVKSNAKKARAVRHYAWLASSRNPELEVEMLRRLNLYLNQRGQQNAATHEGGDAKTGRMAFNQLADGTPVLVINSDFNQAWVLLGIAIDRAGYTMEKQDRQNGLYRFAQVTDKKTGFLVKETVSTFDNYSIGLADQGNQQVAVLRSHNRQTPTPAEAKAILQKISQEIQF